MAFLMSDGAEVGVTLQQSGTRISHRETRLRRRIDELTDQRDRALAELYDTRDRNDELEARVDRLHSKNNELRRSRDSWKERARIAEWGGATPAHKEKNGR